MDYEQLAAAPLGDNILAQIAQTARDIVAAQKDVVDAEAMLKDRKKQLRMLQEDVLPELMAAAGQESLTTADGWKVSIKTHVRGTPTKAKQEEAFRWLGMNGHAGIIKTNVHAPAVPPEYCAAAVEALNEIGLTADVNKSVHWQTLGALVRELMGRGESVPLDTLGVHVWKQADVKPA